LVQIAVWGALSAHFIAAPQNDSLEQVLLSQELRPAYGKHPPLPTWILYGVNQIFGPSIAATFVLGALCSAATLLLLYAWARPLIGAPRAALVSLLGSSIEFMNAGTTYFNHNTVQLPFALLAIILFHRALVHMRRVDWLGLGVGAALVMLVKFSAVVLFAAFAVYLLVTRCARDTRTLRGVALAGLVCAALLAPLLIAASAEPATPADYATQALFPEGSDRLERAKSVWDFAVSHAAKVAPALLLFLWLRRHAPPAPQRTGETLALAPFLTLVGFGPIAMTLCIALLAGTYLLVGWGTTFHVLFTFWLVAASPWAIAAPQRVLLRAAAACIALQVAIWSVVAANGGTLPNLRRMKSNLTALPPPQLAEALQRAWSAHSAALLRYVIADVRTGAVLAVQFRGAPRVVAMNRGDFDAVLPPQVLRACGSVTVTSRAPVEPGSRHFSVMDRMFDATTLRSIVELPGKPAGGQKFYVAIRPPEPGGQCTGAGLGTNVKA
ncbi:MAG: glycosyltransferase family 39 protein, partial [Burkholderiaceae bacterium]